MKIKQFNLFRYKAKNYNDCKSKNLYANFDFSITKVLHIKRKELVLTLFIVTVKEHDWMIHENLFV